jgi:predicted SprT family Zn-dependent metalloprotease
VSLIPEQERLLRVIIWYHNHLRSYRNRYLLETVLLTRPRELNTSEEEMGEMMRFVIAHEVGHALGFPHNMGRVAPDTEIISRVCQKNGIAASLIMPF